MSTLRPSNATGTQLNLTVYIEQSAGNPLAAPAHDTANLSIRYRRADQSAWTTLTLVAGTLGSYTASGLIATGVEGYAQLGLPAAAILEGTETAIQAVYDGHETHPAAIYWEPSIAALNRPVDYDALVMAQLARADADRRVYWPLDFRGNAQTATRFNGDSVSRLVGDDLCGNRPCWVEGIEGTDYNIVDSILPGDPSSKAIEVLTGAPGGVGCWVYHYLRSNEDSGVVSRQPEFALAMWTQGVTVAGGILAQEHAGDGVRLQTSDSSADVLQFRRGNSVIASGAWVANDLNHIAVTRDRDNLVTLYLNGAVLDTATDASDYYGYFLNINGASYDTALGKRQKFITAATCLSSQDINAQVQTGLGNALPAGYPIPPAIVAQANPDRRALRSVLDRLLLASAAARPSIASIPSNDTGSTGIPSFDLSNASSVTVGDYLIVEGSLEVMQVTGLSGSTVTVTRDVLGTAFEHLVPGLKIFIVPQLATTQATADANQTALNNLGDATALAAALEQALVNDGDSTAFLQAVADKIAGDLTSSDLTAQAIAAATRDLILDRVLAGNHDTTGTVGRALQDASTGSGGSGGPVDGLARSVFEQVLLAFIAGQTSLVDNGNATKTLTFLAQDGTTPVFTVTFDATGQHTQTEVLVA